MSPLRNHYSYDDITAMLGQKRMCKVGTNTYAAQPTFEGKPDDIHIIYHSTHIVTLHHGGAVSVLVPADHKERSSTTKDRINRFLPYQYSLYSDQGCWFFHVAQDNLNVKAEPGKSYLIGVTT